MGVNIASNDDSERLQEQIHTAKQNQTPLRIRGGDSKRHLGRPVEAQELDTRGHTGIVHYDPTELVVTVRAGTSLQDLYAVLAAQGQHFPPEAPVFEGAATVGGMVAAGMAGPRRPWAGSVRDFVLGARFISAEGKHMRFGGEVMKNVAGYDFSRLLVGSQGCLGVITEVSLKVLPLPRASHSLKLQVDANTALDMFKRWRRDTLPITGAMHWNGYLYLRLEGGKASVDAARTKLAGTEVSTNLWADLREHRLSFFDATAPLWRLSVPWQAPHTELPGDTLLDWAGAQRWLKSNVAPQEIRNIARSLGGHASCFTPGVDDSPFEPIAPALMHFHQRLKKQIDPLGLFNPGRMYANL